MREIGNDIKIIDNFLPKSFANSIEDFLSSNAIWMYKSYTTNPNITETDNYNKNIHETAQFVHPIISEGTAYSEFYESMKSFLFFLEDKFQVEISGLLRIKANLLIPNGLNNDSLYHTPHIDDGDKTAYSFLYYVNDSDGDTFFFDKTVEQGPYRLKPIHRETPKKNTVVMFPSKRFHSSSNPIKNNKRIVLNTVLNIK